MGEGLGLVGGGVMMVRDAGGTQRQMSQTSADGTSVPLLLTASRTAGGVCAEVRGQRGVSGIQPEEREPSARFHR